MRPREKNKCAAIALRCNVYTYTLFLYLFIYHRKHKVSGRVRCRRPSLSIAKSEKFLSKKFFRWAALIVPLPFTDYLLPFTDCYLTNRLPIICYRLPITVHRLFTTAYRLPFTDNSLPFTDSLLTISYWTHNVTRRPAFLCRLPATLSCRLLTRWVVLVVWRVLDCAYL